MSENKHIDQDYANRLEAIAAGKAKKSKPQPPKESSFVNSAIDKLTAIGGTWEKRHGTAYGKAGQPDITGCLCGRRVEIEAKMRGNEPTEIQLERLAKWSRAGAACAVLWDKEPTNTAAMKVMHARAQKQVDITILHGLDDMETYVRNIIGEPKRDWTKRTAELMKGEEE